MSSLTLDFLNSTVLLPNLQYTANMKENLSDQMSSRYILILISVLRSGGVSQEQCRIN